MAGRNEFNVILGKKIKALRERRGWDQPTLQFELDYNSSGIISLIEAGKSGMKREKIYLAAEKLGVPAWVLFDDQDYSEEQLAMYADFHTLLKNRDSQYYGAIKALLKQAATE